MTIFKEHMMILPGWFWGSFFILFGASIIIKEVFKIDLPVGKMFFALFLMLIGLNMLIDNSLITQSYICKIL